MAWAPLYAVAADLREYTHTPDSDDDAHLLNAVTAASRAVDLFCGRQFGKVDSPEERTYTAEWDRRRAQWLIEIDDLMTTDGLTITVEAGSITAYTLLPLNAAQNGKPWDRLLVDTGSSVTPDGTEGGVTIEATWGWSSVPVAVKQATLLQASRIFARRTSPFGVAGSPELGSELRLLARLDPDVSVSLRPYIRWWGAA